MKSVLPLKKDKNRTRGVECAGERMALFFGKRMQKDKTQTHTTLVPWHER